MFETRNLSKQYGAEFALNDVIISIGKGMNFIVGASGSGKTTLLKILSGMEKDFEGSVTYLGKEMKDFTDKEKSDLYHSTFGFVWQDFHLLDEATVLENILLPTYLSDKDAKQSANSILKQMKLEDVKGQKVRFLSGGQKQRVAIARELMKSPEVIFCDEPTSALDAKSAKIIMDILRGLSKSKTVIVVTHDTSLITGKDNVFELDKGELISAPEALSQSKAVWKEVHKSGLSIKNAFGIALNNLKNKPGRFAVSVLSFVIAGMLLLTTFSGAVEETGQAEFDKLIETYGEGILDISMVGSFMSAGGAGDANDGPSGNVEQDLSGLYEKYQNDERVEFIISSQAFDNIEVTVDGQAHSVEKTGSTPVLTKLLSGNIPNGDEFQVVIPLKFAESIGLTPETAIGKEIDFSATIYKWINEQPIPMPVELQATVCGVSDNTVVYDYEGEQYTYTVDDSFFFNKAAIEEARRQAGIENETINFIMRAKTPVDLISLKDELNRSGIVPLGRFELVEDIVRLNQQTSEQSGSASAVIGVLAVLLAVIISAMTAALRRREYAIYKVSGYKNNQLMAISASETVLAAIAAVLLMAIASLPLHMVTDASALATGALLILAVSVVAFIAGVPFIATSSVSSMLKAGDKS